MNTPNINIEKLKNIDVEEYNIISYLFGMDYYNIKTFLDYGFIFDYEHNYLTTNITINNIDYEIRINRNITQTNREYYIHMPDYKSRSYLKGYNTYYLYCDKNIDIANFNTNCFLYWIKNIYDLNNTTETFKGFIATEINKNTLDT